MSSLFIRADSIITIYDQRNVTPVRNAIRRETNQPDLPTTSKDVGYPAQVKYKNHLLIFQVCLQVLARGTRKASHWVGQGNSCDKPNSSSLTHSVWSFNSEDRTKYIKLMIYLSIQIDTVTVSGGRNMIILTINVCVQCSPMLIADQYISNEAVDYDSRLHKPL